MGRKEKGAARRAALLGVLFALAAVLSLFEGALAPALGLPPGVKPGLANTVVMFALLFLGLPQAACLAVLKALLALLARGAVAGALSLCGGLFSVGVMWLLHRFARPTPFICRPAARWRTTLGSLRYSPRCGVHAARRRWFGMCRCWR